MFVDEVINHVFMSFFAVQIYDCSYTCIHLHSSPSTGYITNSQCDEPPDGLIAQLVDLAEVMGSNPGQA